MLANEHIRIGSNSYEDLKTFKYFGSLVTNKNCILDEMKYTPKAMNSTYYPVQTLLSSQILTRNLKIKKLPQVVTFLRPPYLVWRHMFYNFNLETIKLQQKCDVTKLRIPPFVTQCHTYSTPFAPLKMSVIYGCPLLLF